MQPDVPGLPSYGGDLLPRSARRSPWLAVLSALAVLAVVAVSLVVVLGGSSGTMSVADATALVHSAGARAQRAGTSSIDLRMTVKVAGHTVSATGGGAFDYRAHVGRLSFDMDGVGEMQEVLTPTALYMRMPDRLSGVVGPATKPWLELRFSALKAQGVDLGKLMSSDTQADPSQLLQLLARSTGIHRDGTATVRGVKTTHFTATSTLLAMLRAQGMAGAVDLSKLPPGVGGSRIHLSVWVDRSGLARRMSMSMDMALYGSMTMTMDLYDFGQPVTVIVPPASITTDVSQALAHTTG